MENEEYAGRTRLGERQAMRERFAKATATAKKVLRKGDRITVTKCPGTKRWIIFDRWDGNEIISASGEWGYFATNISRLNGEPVNFNAEELQRETDALVRISPYTKVLCGDCLRIRDYTDERHRGDDLCECGGEFCGCEVCTDTMNALLTGKRKASELVCQNDIERWNEVDGVNAPNANDNRA